MKSSMKKIMLAVISTLFAAAMVGTSTYAWFSMNNKVDVTGMTVMATVDQNLLVAADTLAQSGRLPDENFGNTLVQSISGTLKPVSSVNGKSFFYTHGKNVKGDGSVMNKEYKAYNAADFNANYGSADATKYVGYVDYVFQLKAVNYSADAEIRLTKLDLIYGDGADSLKAMLAGGREIDTKAFRAAVFYKNVTDGSAVSATADSLDGYTTLALFKPEGATNFEENKAVSTVTTLGAVNYCNSYDDPETKAKINIAGEDTMYLKVVVRIWMEGEDNTCRSDAYVKLNEKWSLDLEFNQVLASDAPNSVIYLNQKTMSVAKPVISTEATVRSAEAYASEIITINAVKYYPIYNKDNTAAILYDGKKLYVTSSKPVTPDSKVYIIPDDDKLYVQEVTNQVEIRPEIIKSAIENGIIKVTLDGSSKIENKTSGEKYVPVKYTWKKDGTTVVEDGAAAYAPTESGEYYCQVTADGDYVYKTDSYNYVEAECSLGTGSLSALIYEATSYQWKNAEADTEVVGKTARTYAAPEVGNYYCVIEKNTKTYYTTIVSILDVEVDADKGTVKLSGGTLSNGKTPAATGAYAWKKADGTAAAGTNDAQAYEAETTGNYYCEVTDTDGNAYRTEIVTLTVAP